MELVTSEVETTRSMRLPMQETLIMPVGDIQYGAAECDFERFKRHIEWGVQQGAYFIGMGDYVDFGSPSNRGKLKALIAEGTLYDTASDILDGAAAEHLEKLQEVLAPTKGRWLGLVEGHHFWEFSDGTTSDTRLCQFLDAPFLGTCGVVEVRFKIEGADGARSHKKPPAFQIWAHHGRGNGNLQSAPLNKLEGIVKSFPSIQVFLIAHHHKKVSGKLNQVDFNFSSTGKGSSRGRNVILACTGGFLRGYLIGNKRGNRAQGSYVERGMMTPVALGGVVIYARPRVSSTGYTDVDLDVSI